jgi:hypothetical protein
MVMVRYAIRNEVGDPRPDLAFAFDCTSCIIQLEKVPFEATNRFVIYNTLFYICHEAFCLTHPPVQVTWSAKSILLTEYHLTWAAPS